MQYIKIPPMVLFHYTSGVALGKLEKPDAVVCLNDVMAYYFQKTLIENGVRVTEDIVVTCFSDNMYLVLSKCYGTNEGNGYLFPTDDIIPGTQ